MERDLVLPHLIAKRAAENPDRVLAIDVEGPVQMTCDQMHRANLVWADAYRRIGVGEGDTVVTMLPSKLETFNAWIGLAWLKAIEVPINIMYVGEMLRYIVDDSDARVMVVSQRFLPALQGVIDRLPKLETVVIADGDAVDLPRVRVLGREEFLSGASPAGLPGPEHWDISCMIYTSGTTGPSKGVLVPWKSIFQFPASLPAEGAKEGSVLYSFYPAFHVSGKNSIYCPALCNGTLVQREVFSVEHFWDDIRTYGCTVAGLLGPLAAFLLMSPPKPDDAEQPCRYISMGPVIPQVEEFKQRFNVQVSTGYGMTEIGVALALEGYDMPNPQTCGKPRPGYEVRIVDEHDVEVPVGTVGEMIVRTSEPWMLNAGYFKMPDKTADAWRNGWFHTGDGFKKDADGNFYFVDRMKDAIRRKGENISSFEVEGLVTRHAGVQECAAIAVKATFTEDEVKVCVVRSDPALTHEDLARFCEETMPRFMVPRFIEFVDALPKTPTQRVQKVELRRDPLNANTWDRESARVT